MGQEALVAKQRQPDERRAADSVFLEKAASQFSRHLDTPFNFHRSDQPESVFSFMRSGKRSRWRRAVAIIGLLAVALPSAFGVPLFGRDIWISLRADGRAGNGMFADPFNGSTAAKLDALMPTIPPKTHIHFGHGIFLTKGFRIKKVGRLPAWERNGRR